MRSALGAGEVDAGIDASASVSSPHKTRRRRGSCQRAPVGVAPQGRGRAKGTGMGKGRAMVQGQGPGRGMRMARTRGKGTASPRHATPRPRLWGVRRTGRGGLPVARCGGRARGKGGGTGRARDDAAASAAASAAAPSPLWVRGARRGGWGGEGRGGGNYLWGGGRSGKGRAGR